MPETGSTFTDWQQVERESRLLIDEDFSWSEPPRRRRRITEAPIRARRRSAVLEYDHELLDGYESPERYLSPERYVSPERYEPHIAHVPAEHLPAMSAWDRPTETHSQFDEMMQRWSAAYGDGADAASRTAAERAFDLSDPGAIAPSHGTRRTVVITGHGDERYLPAPRRPRSSPMRFHERSGFSPDRAGLWAVLLGIALVIGAIAH